MDNLDKSTALLNAHKTIADFHADGQKYSNKIKLVYFYPRERTMNKDWPNRLHRTMEDINHFFIEEFKKFGVKINGLPFERGSNGKIVFHIVKSEEQAESYNYYSGNKIYNEIKNKLGETIDFGKEFTFIITALSYKNNIGMEVFHSPYYGIPNKKIAFAVDSNYLDPELYNDKFRKITYQDATKGTVTESVGDFNSKYIGGIAHELAHALGLPHTAGSNNDSKVPSVPLMNNGNLYFRANERGEKRTAFLTLASALTLISSPLLTNSNKALFRKAMVNWKKVTTQFHDKQLSVKVLFESDIPAYAAVAYLWKPNNWPGNPQNDHNSPTWTTLVEDKSLFKFNFGQLLL
ncbi:hypothetical protein [Psychrosphaera algicola]|uniref:Uncharacterized protein n=1 Tax=Psychrosphaera algicola TaxID=3023714 RepID=A0ABT5FDP9_9GAMM|nr:hypothetical protein [Psychrosphaera sp. G1-22]MDC2888988.1 hypothetical protein [Psychrosphaera sp. G1-22]